MPRAPSCWSLCAADGRGAPVWARSQPDGFAPRFETTHELGAQRGRPGDRLRPLLRHGRDLLTARGWLEQGGLRAQRRMRWRPRWSSGLAGWPKRPRAVPPAQRAALGRAPAAVLLQGMEAPAVAHRGGDRAHRLEWVAASRLRDRRLARWQRRARASTCWSCCEGFQAEAGAASPVRQLGASKRWLAAARSAPGGAIALHPAADPEQEAELAAACVLRHLAKPARARRAGRHRPRAHAPHRRPAVHARRRRARRDRLEAVDHARRRHVMGALRACATMRRATPCSTG
jgi:ATP-dependent helicase/nuclease subunit B